MSDRMTITIAIRKGTVSDLDKYCSKNFPWKRSTFIDKAIEEKLSRELCITDPEMRRFATGGIKSEHKPF